MGRASWLQLLAVCVVGTLATDSAEDGLQQELHDYLTEDIKAYQKYLTQHKITEIRFPDLCPQPPQTFAEADCRHPTCLSDDNCTQANHSCCFNGCVFTCLPDIHPPPVFDWIDENNRTLPVALNENDDDYEIECSTFRDHVMPSCPDGFACQILERGDPLRAIPNRGICVSLKDLGHDGLGLFIEEAAAEWGSPQHSLVKESVYLPGGCLLTTEQYGDMEDFIRGTHFTSCVCSAGTVLCSVPIKTQRRPHHSNHTG